MHRNATFPRGIRLFKNPLLDVLSRLHPVLLGLFWIPVSIVMIAGGTAGGVPVNEAVLLAPFGLLLWFFAEYAIHRWLFHFRPRSPFWKRYVYLLHEHHHRYQERDRLVAPPLMSGLLFTFFLSMLTLTIGLWFGFARMWVVFGGLVLGYVYYDYVHMYMHTGRPKSRMWRFMRRCHLQHHSNYPNCWYSVSCPWMDYLFGTYSRRAATSGATRPPMAENPHTRPFRHEELPESVRRHEDLHGVPVHGHSVDADRTEAN